MKTFEDFYNVFKLSVTEKTIEGVVVELRQIAFSSIEQNKESIEEATEVYRDLFIKVFDELYVITNPSIKNYLIDKLSNWINKLVSGKHKFSKYIIDNIDQANYKESNTMVILSFYKTKNKTVQITSSLLLRNPSTKKLFRLDGEKIYIFKII